MLAMIFLVKPSMSFGDFFFATRASDFEMMLRPFLCSVSARLAACAGPSVLEGLVGHVREHDAETSGSADLSDTGAHEASTEDRYTLDL